MRLESWVLALTLFALTSLRPAMAEELSSSHGQLKIEPVVTGLEIPWSFDFFFFFLILVTEREGKLLHVQGGRARTVRGTPAVAAVGQGGLLDVPVARDFATSRAIFLTYSKRQGRGAGTALAVGRLSDDNTRLTQVRELFEAAPGATGGRHFGARVVEARDGSLFVSLGERGDRPSAQDLRRHQGAIIRINRDGSVPSDNPFVNRS